MIRFLMTTVPKTLKTTATVTSEYSVLCFSPVGEKLRTSRNEQSHSGASPGNRRCHRQALSRRPGSMQINSIMSGAHAAQVSSGLPPQLVLADKSHNAREAKLNSFSGQGTCQWRLISSQGTFEQSKRSLNAEVRNLLNNSHLNVIIQPSLNMMDYFFVGWG